MQVLHNAILYAVAEVAEDKINVSALSSRVRLANKSLERLGFMLQASQVLDYFLPIS